MIKKITKSIALQAFEKSKKSLFSALFLLSTVIVHAQFPAPYCNFTLTYNWEPITLVNFAGINQASDSTIVTGATASNQGLTNYLSDTGTVAQGLSSNMVLKGNTGGTYTNYFTVFIDWNQNGSFTDAGESYSGGSVYTSTGLDAVQATSSILVPANATLGNTRMRIVKKFNTASTDPCASSWGAAQDYTIKVITPPCTPPTVTFTTVPNCASNQYSVNVNISNMGTATSIGIGDGTNNYGTATATGNYTAGPYATGSSNIITLTNTNSLCNVSSAAQVYNCPPANDECSAATGLTVNSDFNCGVTATGTTVGATQSTETAPTVNAAGTNDDVWYKFTATSTSHRIALSNVSGSTDMAMAVYSGVCGSLVHVLSSDPNSMDVTGLTVGQEYKIRVYTYTATVTTMASFTICVGTPPPPPSNDECSNAAGLTVNADYNCGVTTNGTTVAATQSNETAPTVNAAGTNDDVWYKFTATSTSHRVSLSNVSGSTDMAMAIYSGVCGSLVHIQSSDPNNMDVTGLTIGQEYKVRVYTYTSTSTTNASFTICIGSAPPPPANDDANGAVALTVNTDLNCASTTNGTTVSATQSTDAAPSCSATGINDDVWYKFTATSPAHQFKFSNVTSGTMAVALYTGTPGALVAVANDCGSGATVNFTDLVPTTQYYARMYTTTSTTTTTTSFTVCLGTLPNMTYDSVTTTQASTAAVAPGFLNQQVLGVLVYVNGANNPLAATKLDFTTSGTMVAGEVTNAKVYYTGSSSTFATTTLFGTAVANPNGSFSVIGSQNLTGGASATTNYFWLVYDINCSAVTGHTVDAICNGATVASVLKTPTVSDPTGSRAVGAPTVFNTVADGDWSAPSTWACGNIPSSTSNVNINNAVTVSTAGNTASNVTVVSGASLTITSGSLTMGAVNGDNKVFTNNGTLTVSGGTFNINGQFINATNATINQSGGNINVDANASGTGTSVTGASNYPINWTITTAANANLTGGVMTLVDPPISGVDYAMYVAYAPAGSVAAGPNHTFRFGDGVSTDAGGTNGFRFYSWQGSGIFKFGKVVLEANTANAASRFVFINGTYFNFAATDDITIKSGAELRQTGTALTGGIFVGKNLTVQSGGTLTVPGIIYFGNVTSSSATVLVGSASTTPQVVTGTGATFRNATTSPTANFAQLTINNSNTAGVTFDANSLLSGTNTGTVSGTLTMTAGIVNVGTNALVLGVSASSTGTYAYTAGKIIGSFKRWLGASTGARAFDIGTGTQGKSLAINFTTAPTAGGSLTAKWTAGSPGSNGLPLTEGSNTYTNTSQNGYWTVSAGDGLTGGTYTATFTVSGGSDAPDYSTVTIGKRATAADPWALVGTAVAATGNASNFTVSRTGMTGFSDFVLLLTSTPLSVKLSSFEGRNAGSVNILNWKTATEKDASHFDVLRSADGNNFEKLATVKTENILTGGKYEFTDAKPFEGKNFYRLNMVDVNGKSVYSDVVVLSVRSSAGLSLTASPNPVNQTLSISINGKIDGAATIHVVDITGKIVQKIAVSSNNTAVDMSALSGGTYIIRYNDNSNSSIIKVTKN